MDKLMELRKVSNRIRKLAHEAQAIEPTFWCTWGIRGINVEEQVGCGGLAEEPDATTTDFNLAGSTM
jgi:hypothetical protein